MTTPNSKCFLTINVYLRGKCGYGIEKPVLCAQSCFLKLRVYFQGAVAVNKQKGSCLLLYLQACQHYVSTNHIWSIHLIVIYCLSNMEVFPTLSPEGRMLGLLRLKFKALLNIYTFIFFQAIINSTVLPNMTFTKTSQKFGQWSDARANTVFGLGFPSEAELNKVGKIFWNKLLFFM